MNIATQQVLQLLTKADFNCDHLLQVEPMAADAGSRSFYRLTFSTNPDKAILVHGPDPIHKTKESIELSLAFKKVGLPVPCLYQQDLRETFLIIQDLGDQKLADKITHTPQDEQYHQKVLHLLEQLARIRPDTLANTLPNFDKTYFAAQNELFIELLPHEKQKEELRALVKLYLQELDDTNLILTHRDFHSENLMLHQEQLYMIDFQDAGFGPIGYDFISYFEDARRSIYKGSNESHEQRIKDYVKVMPTLTLDQFKKNCLILSLLRHLRVIAIFKRLANEEGKTKYLSHLPRLWEYLTQIMQHPEMLELKNWSQHHNLKDIILEFERENV